MHRLGKDYEKPPWNIHQIEVQWRQGTGDRTGNNHHAVLPPAALQALHGRSGEHGGDEGGARGAGGRTAVGPPRHLLRDTVRTLLQDHKVYITDWIDARMVPADAGQFELDDYVATIEEFIRHIAPRISA
jgi:poly(3-hydroxybutyrate) depolymerase